MRYESLELEYLTNHDTIILGGFNSRLDRDNRTRSYHSCIALVNTALTITWQKFDY